jgi:hypothetical protein
MPTSRRLAIRHAQRAVGAAPSVRGRHSPLAFLLLSSLALALPAGLWAPPAAAAPGAPPPVTEKDYPSARFTNSTKIDNQWLPLVPGTQFTLTGEANRGVAHAPHEVIFTVTDVTKVIDGVNTVVVWDRDINEGQLAEEELAFMAQDDGGNVWLMGEYPEEYENGLPVGAPSTWIPGQKGSLPGVLMRADPKVKTSSYHQGLAPAVQFQDQARVDKEHQQTCVPAGCYQDVVIIDEWNPLEQPQDGHQLKYHAPGVGNVRIEPSGGVEQETLVLSKVETLTPAGLVEARARALRLDAHAYQLVPDIYGPTQPAAGPADRSGSAPGAGTPGPALGYRLVASDGGIFSFGQVPYKGSAGDTKLARPVVGMASTAGGQGYWLVASDGGIFAFGDAAFMGSTGNIKLVQPIVGMAPTASGKGYWLVASDGGIFAFGDAAFKGSTGGTKLAQPIVGMTPTPSGNGYWLVASDGGIFAFGDATFQGSTGNLELAKPIVGMTPTPSGNGYWLVASDGGMFAFGDATFQGSTGASKLAQPIVGMAATSTGLGYWLVAADGGIFAFGDAPFLGSAGAVKLARPIVGIAAS